MNSKFWLTAFASLAISAPAMAEHHENACEHKQHEAHDHSHGDKCGHKAAKHGDHTDYEHDGHKHKAHGDHVDECSDSAPKAKDSKKKS